MTENDIPFAVELAHRRYSNRYDHQASEMWFRNIVLKGPLMFWPVRTPDAFLIAMLSVTPWLPADSECNIIMLCAEDNSGWQAMSLLRASVEWARRRKCAVWRIVSETEFDLGQLALRIGAKEITPRYTLKL